MLLKTASLVWCTMSAITSVRCLVFENVISGWCSEVLTESMWVNAGQWCWWVMVIFLPQLNTASWLSWSGWYFNFWISSESPLHLFLLFGQESIWGAYQTHLFCTFYFTGIFFAWQTRWSFNLKFYGHSHLTKCGSYLSWVRSLL